MKVRLTNKVGNIFCEEVTIKKDELPCKCGSEERNVFIGSVNPEVNLKKDIVLYWCSSCDQPKLINDGGRKNNIIYPIEAEPFVLTGTRPISRG